MRKKTVNERKIVFQLVLIMVTATLTVAGMTIFTLYGAAFKEGRARLVETAQSQARLMEAVARFDTVYSTDYPRGAEEATLSQIIDAHKHYEGFGETGEFTLAKREGDYIVFLLSHRHFDLESPKPVPFDSDIAEPMRRALSGFSGTVVGPDYRGESVLAAYEPVAELDHGIVAKIDLSEIRAPFLKAGAVAVSFAILVVIAGAGLFLRVSNPIIRRLEEHSQQLEETVEALRESEEKYRSMMEAMTDPVYICSPDFRVAYMNPAMVQRTGRNAIGDPCYKVINDLDEKCPWCVHEEIQQGEHAETEIVSPRDGRFYHVSHSPIFHVDSSISKMTIFRDITEQKQAEKELNIERDNLLNIFNSMQDGVYIVNQQHDIEFVNIVLEREFGPPEKKKCYEYFHARKKVCPWCKNPDIFAGRTVRWEWYSPKNKKTYDLIDTPLTNPDGSVSKLEIFRDITEYKRMEAELRTAHDELERRVEERTAELVRANELLKHEIQERNRVQLALEESEKHYRELWDNAPAAYHMLDAEGIIKQVNQTELDMLGYTRDEMLGKPIFEFVMPEQRDDAEQRFRLKLTGKEIPKQDNRTYMKKDGSEMNVSIDDILERDTDGKVVGVRTTMVDITDLKRAQEELRHLSAQLLEVQENERKKLSRDLHDSTGQLLAALRFGMENALDRMRHGTIGESVELLETVIPLAQQASDEVRRIHTDLRPSLIDDLGIVATISWFCREFETLHAGVRMEQMILTDEKEVPEPLKIVIFRILQEALNNIAKYGKADRVRISLREKDGKLELAIEDNGQGFDVEYVRSEKNADRGVGLTSMKERTELSGGSFSIESSKGEGTTVRASWVKE